MPTRYPPQNRFYTGPLWRQEKSRPAASKSSHEPKSFSAWTRPELSTFVNLFSFSLIGLELQRFLRPEFFLCWFLSRCGSVSKTQKNWWKKSLVDCWLEPFLRPIDFYRPCFFACLTVSFETGFLLLVCLAIFGRLSNNLIIMKHNVYKAQFTRELFYFFRITKTYIL